MAIKRTRNSGLTVPELVKPQISGSVDIWGLLLNENIDKQTLFNTKLVQDSETQNQEITRLDREKVSTSDVSTIVEPIVIQVIEDTGKPMLDDYMEETIKPSIDTYISGKKGEIDNYVNLTSKPSLDSYEKVKEGELNSYTTTKKGELDTHTLTKQTQLDNYEKTKENQLNSYTSTKQTQLDSYTSDKKSELDSHTSTKKSQLDSYEKSKESELDTYTTSKKEELDTYESAKESELNSYTSTKKNEINSYTTTKKSELDTYTTSKKSEITAHTDSEIERINADSELANKANKTVQVIAGNGLVGGGDLSTNRTINIASADDGITVNADNIKLNIVDNATTDSTTRAGSARQIKLLSENKVNKTDIVDDLTTADKSKVLSANMGNYLEDNKQNKTDNNLQTDSKEIVGAINELDSYGYSAGGYGTFHEVSTSLDDVRKSGIYYHQSATGTKPNDIVSYYGITCQLPSSDKGRLQIVSDFNKLNLYARVQQSNIQGLQSWYSILTSNNPLFLGTQGVSSIVYIQDEGQKTAGNGYVDKTTGKLYLCKTTTSDTSVTTNFVLATNIDNSSRLALIEERLGIYSPVGKIQSISVSRNEDSSSPTLTYSSV